MGGIPPRPVYSAPGKPAYWRLIIKIKWDGTLHLDGVTVTSEDCTKQGLVNSYLGVKPWPHPGVQKYVLHGWLGLQEVAKKYPITRAWRRQDTFLFGQDSLPNGWAKKRESIFPPGKKWWWPTLRENYFAECSQKTMPLGKYVQNLEIMKPPSHLHSLHFLTLPEPTEVRNKMLRCRRPDR